VCRCCSACAQIWVDCGDINADDVDGICNSHVGVFDYRGNIMRTIRINTKDGGIGSNPARQWK
jgi:hypothetical protein